MVLRGAIPRVHEAYAGLELNPRHTAPLQPHTTLGGVHLCLHWSVREFGARGWLMAEFRVKPTSSVSRVNDLLC